MNDTMKWAEFTREQVRVARRGLEILTCVNALALGVAITTLAWYLRSGTL